MESKNAARFLAFDSLKGLKESIEEADKDSKAKKPIGYISEEDKEEMDILLHRSYILQEMVIFSVFHHGTCEEIIDVIKKIDPIRHRVQLSRRGYIYLAEIRGIRAIGQGR